MTKLKAQRSYAHRSPRSESFACELENFACETFSFRMSSAKPLKTFWFSRPRNFRLRGFQCYQCLATDFVSRFFSATFSGRWAKVGRRVFFTEQFTLPQIRLFGKPNSDNLTSLIIMPCRARIRGSIPGSSAGAGNFAESATFCENPSRKHLGTQAFAR